MKHIYLDINIFGKENEFIGYGALVCNEEIHASKVNMALNDLKNDPDIKSPNIKDLDELVIRRGYFHASKDSQNAHSHICLSLNNNIEGLYRAELFDRYISRSNSEKAFQLIRNLYLLKALNTRENITVVFEQSNNLKLEYFESSFKRLYRELLSSSYSNPFEPVFYPKVNFKIAKKSEPGLQFIDFLLWATQRKFNGKDDWYNRINAVNTSESKNEYNIWSGINFEINYSPSVAESFYAPADIKADDIQINDDMLIKVFLSAIKIVSYYSENHLPRNINHIKEDLLYLHNNRKDLNAYGYIKKLAKAFLLLFDMIPLIKASTTETEKLFLITAKKYLSAVLNNEIIEGKKAADFLSNIRKSYIREQPELFG